jgi:hypothetical protein
MNKDNILTDTQFVVDKSVTPTPPVYSPNVDILYPDGRNIGVDGDLFAPPYNFQNQTFNPVYMTQTTALYTTGDLCYVVCGGNSVIQIFNNNNITNPIPPNVVPSDFGNSSNVGFTLGIPLFSLSPVLPSTPQTAILSDTLEITTDTDVSILSATDLTFNGVSVITNLTILQKSVYNQYISAAVYADGRPPTAPTTTIAQQYAYTPSWYFKNTTAGYKINWYVGANAGMIVSDIIGLYLAFFNGNNSSNDNTPFITIYTTATGSGDYAPGFYHSACTYIFDGSIAANTRYLEFLNLDNCPTPNYYGATLRSMIQSPVAPNPRGQYLPTESVAFFAIGSNSAAAVNSVEFAISKFGIMTASGTTEVNYFQN